MVLQESVTKISWRDSLNRWESATSHGSRRSQTETAGVHQWEKPVVSSRQRDMKPQRRNAGGRKSKCSASLSSSSQTFVCPKCASRISLYSHQRVCKNWPSTFPKILVCEEWAITDSALCTRTSYGQKTSLTNNKKANNKTSKPALTNPS